MPRPPSHRPPATLLTAALGLLALGLWVEKPAPLGARPRETARSVGGRPEKSPRLAMRILPLGPAWTHSAEGLEEAPDVPDEAHAPGGISPDRVRPAASRAACLAELRRRRIPFREVASRPPVRHPVEITGPVHGVLYKALYTKAPPLVDCHFALGLEQAARVLSGFGVTTVLYTSTFRSPPRARWVSPGHHPLGMAMDVNELHLRDGTHLVILKDWEKQYGGPGPGSCVGRPRTAKGALLRKMTCALEEAHIFLRIISPDSDFPHRNHWHISGAHIGEAFARRRYCGRALDQPLPGDRGFARWYRWYSCWKLAKPRSRYLCYQRRARRKPGPPVRFRAPLEAPRVGIWVANAASEAAPEPELPASARSVELPDDPSPRRAPGAPPRPAVVPGGHR